MIKSIVYSLLSIVLLVLLYRSSGSISIDWLGYQTEIELIFLIPTLIIIKVISLKIFFSLIELRKKKNSTNQGVAIGNVINGLSYVKIGDSLSANICINRAKLLKETPIMYLLQANNELLNCNVENSKKYLMKIVKNRDILTITALNQMLEIAYSEKDLFEVESIINQMRSLFPKDMWTLLKQGEFFCYTKKYGKALKAFEGIKKYKLKLKYNLKNRISVINYAIAKEYYLKGDYNKTLDHLDNAGVFVGTILLKGRVFYDLKKENKAKIFLETEYRKNPHIDILKLYTELGGNKEKLEDGTVIDNNNKFWQCINCYVKIKEWDYMCKICDKFDTIRWL